MIRLSASEAIMGLESMLGNVEHLQSKGAYRGDVRLRVEATFCTYVAALRSQGKNNAKDRGTLPPAFCEMVADLGC